MKNTNYLTTARDYLSRGQLSDSIALLKKNVKDEDIGNQILQLEARHSSLKRKMTAGTIDVNDAQLEENRISNSVLMIISNLAKEGKILPEPKPSKKGFDFKWLIIGLLALGLAGLGYYTLTQKSRTVVSNPCDKIECRNGGKCINGKCDCPKGFSGIRCERKVGTTTPPADPCAKIRCMNGGKCVDGKCKCPDGFGGRICQTRINKPENSGGQSISKPDLRITAFQMKPETPVKGEKVYMQAIVKNLGSKNAGKFKIEWWASTSAPKPAFEKTVSGLPSGEQHIFSFQYKGYPSWYGSMTSKLVVDSGNTVKESNEKNNVLKKSYAVKK